MQAFIKAKFLSRSRDLVFAMATQYPPEKVHDLPNVDEEALDSDQDSTTEVIKALVAEDHDHDIKLRTMSWQRAAWLLAGDQVCLAIMAQSWSLSYVIFMFVLAECAC
jgi:hypothetical protein